MEESTKKEMLDVAVLGGCLLIILGGVITIIIFAVSWSSTEWF